MASADGATDLRGGVTEWAVRAWQARMGATDLHGGVTEWAARVWQARMGATDLRGGVTEWAVRAWQALTARRTCAPDGTDTRAGAAWLSRRAPAQRPRDIRRCKR